MDQSDPGKLLANVFEDCIGNTSFSKLFVLNTILQACTYCSDTSQILLDTESAVTSEEGIEIAEASVDLLERLNVLTEMCTAECVVLDYLFDCTDISNALTYLLQTTCSIGNFSSQLQQFSCALFKVIQPISSSHITDSELMQEICRLCLQSIEWMNPQIMEICFEVLDNFCTNPSSPIYLNSVRDCFCSNESLPGIVDFVFKNSLRPKLLENLWKLLTSIICSKSDAEKSLYSHKLVQLYLPVLTDNVFNKDSNRFNDLATIPLLSYSKILMCSFDLYGQSLLASLPNGCLTTSENTYTRIN
uniref:MMS19 nucleotide excision repair protein n=1 Tax=Ditylenchus dipsaci TaxID=166011 RepID=A0A915D8J5_9BILA